MDKETKDSIEEIKKYAKDNDVPIMLDDGIEFLTDFIVQKNIKNILEVGTAIGFSSIMMALQNDKIRVTTIERDEERYLEALKNIKKLKLEDRINLVFGDALEVKLPKEKYDLIFLDGAKGQNIKFLERFEDSLSEYGYFITDNINFHGYVKEDENEIKSRNLRGLVRKIKAYIAYLNESEKYTTKFYEIGDGIAVTERKR